MFSALKSFLFCLTSISMSHHICSGDIRVLSSCNYMVYLSGLYFCLTGLQGDQAESMEVLSKLASCVSKQASLCWPFHVQSAKPWYEAGTAQPRCLCCCEFFVFDTIMLQ